MDETAPQLSEEQQRLVELYARDPNPTQIAEILGIHRATVYRRLDEPGVQEAIVALRIKLDGDRNAKVEAAQDTALELISLQLERLKQRMAQDPDFASVADAQKLMQIAEKLGAMKKTARKGINDALARSRQESGSVDWGTDPSEDE